MSGQWRGLRFVAPAMRVMLAIGLSLGLAVACSEQAPEVPEAAGNGAKTDAPATAAAPVTAAPEQPVAKPAEPVAPSPAGGFEPAPNVRSDPGLAASAEPPGRATARWGSSGPDVGGKSPWRSLAYDGIHDPESDAVRVLQQPRSALRSLPRGRSGNLIDWASALNDGVIRPRARAGSQGQMEVLDLDILLTDTKNMPVVTFPHRTHTEWLSCRNCHEWLFKSQLGANDISMADIARGRACGLCHGKVSFPPTDCFRCHDGPRPGG